MLRQLVISQEKVFALVDKLKVVLCIPYIINYEIIYKMIVETIKKKIHKPGLYAAFVHSESLLNSYSSKV